MYITSITKGTLSGLLVGLTLTVCVGVASAAGGDGTGGGTGNGTGGGNRDGSGGGKQVGRQIEVGETKKKVKDVSAKRQIVIEGTGTKIEIKTEAEPAPVVEAPAVESTEALEVAAEVAPEVTPEPVVVQKVVVKKKAKAKKKVIVVETAPAETYGYDEGYGQYDDNVSYAPSGGYGGDSCE